MKVARCAAFGFTCLISGAIYPQEDDSKAVKNRDFLKFSEEEKKFWLYSAIDTLGFVAGYKDVEKGRCVWEWYYKDVGIGNGLILAYMEQNPDISPSAVMIALTEKECGAYVRVTD